MGLFDFLLRLFFPGQSSRHEPHDASADTARRPRRILPRTRPHLVPDRAPSAGRAWDRDGNVAVTDSPYAFARFRVGTTGYLDLSRDGDDARLAQFGLPRFRTPAELAAWAGIPLGRLAWLVHRFTDDSRPKTEAEAHYHYHWLAKRGGGRRLIESPKRKLKDVQRKILAEIVGKVPPHSSAHGFTPRRSILTNAKPHVGQAILVTFDLANFYPSVSFARVTAIFRGLGYSREAAIWLARITTSALPANIPFLKQDPSAVLPYLRRHLPQGAPTSPAIANLSAYSLDVRLSGLARAFGAVYTRYADDLTFSGPSEFSTSLRDFIPLVKQIIRRERFRWNGSKNKVRRACSSLVVTGVVVNEKPNVRRRDFDRLKAVLTNCIREGPSTQNHAQHPHFAAHLRGRIAHVAHLNGSRGTKLLALYERIDWKR
jgi:RNA-directed DNA polymerase